MAMPSGRRGALASVLAIGVLSCSAAWAAGAGYAIELDGIGGYLGCDLPGALRDCQSITLSAWILPEGPRGDLISPEPRGQAAVGLGFHFGISAGKVFCAKGTGAGAYVVLVGATSAPISTWHHVAASYDGFTMRVYLDGLLDGSLDDASPIVWSDLPPVDPPGQSNFPSPAQLYIGADKHNDVGAGPTAPDFDFYEGCVDEAQVWDHALSQGEIDFYRRISLTGSEPGLVDYWKFDQGTGVTTADAGSAHADLTLYPGAVWKVSTAPVNVTGVDATPGAAGPDRLVAFPIPAPGEVTIRLDSASRDAARLSIFDPSGRRIVDLWSGATSAGQPLTLRWDGRDRDGRLVPNGVYLVRCDRARTGLATRLLMLR
jgi:hypothetical protein